MGIMLRNLKMFFSIGKMYSQHSGLCFTDIINAGSKWDKQRSRERWSVSSTGMEKGDEFSPFSSDIY